MNKKLIRLTEGDLHRIVKESLNRILKETYDPCDELGHIRWRNRDYRNNSDDAQRVGKKRGKALANWNKRVKDSENKTVEESVNEVMYNGRSYHGSNSNDWRDLGDERENRMFRRDPRMGTKVSDMDSEQLLNHAKNGLDFSKIKSLNDRIDSKGNVHNDMNNMTPEEWQQWTKDASASIRNYGNYHATRNDYTPNEKEKYSQKAYEKARDWNNYRNRGFNAALQQWNENTIKRAVEESVNEVMYNGVSYHGTNPYDWVDIADERSQMGWKNRDDVSKYNQARFKAKDQGDLEGAEAASIMADKHRQQWNKNWGAAERNRNNAKQLGWQGQNDTRLGKAQEYYNMSQNAQNPQDRQRYNQMAQNTLGDVEGRANQALKRLRGENVIKRAVEESVQKILKEDNGSYRGIVLLDTGNSEEELRQKIDACYNKGMSTERIQNAVNWWANWWNNQSDEYRKLCQQ